MDGFNTFDAGLGITARYRSPGITAPGITTLGITTQGSARIAQAASHFHRSTSTQSMIFVGMGSFTDAEARRLLPRLVPGRHPFRFLHLLVCRMPMIDASHNRWKLPCQSIPVYALIISAFFVSGCNPGTNTETPSPASNSLSLSTGAPQGQSTTKQDPPGKKQDENRVSITGDLNAVDWQSHVGKQIMIEGDLVIVDTYDLARRGQIKVARNRLLVPTSQVDPNDADPTATSSQGNSNVAKVIELQETNDRGSITVDDGRTEQNVFPLTLFPEIGKPSHPFAWVPLSTAFPDG